MAKRRTRSKKKYNLRGQTSFFKAQDARTLEQFIVASILGGICGGLGFAIGNTIFKYFIKETERVIPLPETLSAVAEKI